MSSSFFHSLHIPRARHLTKQLFCVFVSYRLTCPSPECTLNFSNTTWTEKCTVQGGWIRYKQGWRIHLIFFHSFIWFQNMATANKTLNPRGSCKEKCGASVEFVHLAALPRRRRMRRVARCAAATEYRPAGHANNRTARMCAKKSRPKIASLCL